jgi:hypothetical protein
MTDRPGVKGCVATPAPRCTASSRRASTTTHRSAGLVPTATFLPTQGRAVAIEFPQLDAALTEGGADASQAVPSPSAFRPSTVGGAEQTA